MTAYHENQLAVWNLQHRVLYMLLLFTNCMLDIFYISKIYNKLNVSIYTRVFLESQLNICQHITALHPSPLSSHFRAFALVMPSAQIFLPPHFCLDISSAIFSLIVTFVEPFSDKKLKQFLFITASYFNSLQKIRYYHYYFCLLSASQILPLSL